MLKITLTQSNGSVEVETRAAFVICADPKGSKRSTGIVMGETNGTDLLAATAMCVAELITGLSGGNRKEREELGLSFSEAVKDMTAQDSDMPEQKRKEDVVKWKD